MASPSSTHSYGSASMSISPTGPQSRASALLDNASPVTFSPRRRLLRGSLPTRSSLTVDSLETASGKNRTRTGANGYTNEVSINSSEIFVRDIPTPHIEGSVVPGPRVRQTSSSTLDPTNSRHKRSPLPQLSTPATTSPIGHSSVLATASIPSTQPTVPPQTPSPRPQPSTPVSTPPPPSLRDLHLAIGQHRIQYLPRLSSLALDNKATTEAGYLPIAIKLGSYRPTDNHPLLWRTYSIWAYQQTPPTRTLTSTPANPHAPIELTAFNTHAQHVRSLPGTGPGPSWATIQQHVRLRPEFTLARSAADVAALVRYALLLAADAGVHGFQGAGIPLDVDFGRRLVEIGERGWYEERFRRFDEMGVLPGYGERETWGALEMGGGVREEVVVYSGSESEGEDEIPAVKPGRGGADEGGALG